MNKEGVLQIRQAQEEERRKRAAEKAAKEARKHQRAVQKQISNAAALEGLELADEEPDEAEFPLVCARTNCRNFLATPLDDSSRWKCCPNCELAPWYCGNKICQTDGGNHIKKCVYNHKLIEIDR